MNLDSYLADAIALLVVGMTVYGGVLAVPAKEGKQRSRIHILIFISVGLVTSVAVVWQNHRNDDQKKQTEKGNKRQIQSLTDEIGDLKHQLEQQAIQTKKDEEHRNVIREGLGHLFDRGRDFSNRCSGGVLTPSCEAEWKQWKVQVRRYLKANRGLSFVARFDAVEHPGFPPFEVIQGELAELEKMMQELKN